MKTLIVLLTAVVLFQACGSSSDGGSPNQPTPGAPGNPGSPTDPGRGQPESGDFFSGVDKAISSSAKGDRLTSERFYVVMARLSVYAMICDFKNELGYSARVSKLWNASTALQKTAEKTYGGEKAAYNRLEKQRNIESNRLSFESGPNACALAQSTFMDLSGQSAQQLSILVQTTPRGNL